MAPTSTPASRLAVAPAILPEVGPGAEGLVAGAGQHDHPDLGVRPGLGHQAGAGPRMTSHDMALRRSGRLMVMRPRPRSTSYSTVGVPETSWPGGGVGDGSGT